MRDAETIGKQNIRAGISRRDALTLAAGALAAPATLAALGETAVAQTSAGGAPQQLRKSKAAPNILFVFTDQERYRTSWPKGLSLPAHEWLQEKGTTFHNHHCPATMCTSSRSVMVTGLTTVDNGMFENCDMPYVGNMSTKIPTIGHMLRKLRYYTAYKGKWHLNRDFDHNDEKLLTDEMEKYGFADYFHPGDIIGHTLGGYTYDHLVAGSAVTWLRKKGQVLSDDQKPWALFVSLVNPHDVMYFNTDAPGENVQNTGNLLQHAARAPKHPLYKATWDEPLPKSLLEPMNAPGRPKAHGEFIKCWDYYLGHIPLEPERWRRFNDYYINCTRAVDNQLSFMLRELEALGLTDNTIIVFTSDHGEAAGSHGMHGKGPFAYKETMHLPLHIVHPDVSGGKSCKALTGHIDFVPTLMSMAGASAAQIGELAGRSLPGKDFSQVFTNPGAASVNEVRQSVLFTYSGLGTNDSNVLRIAAEAKLLGKKPIMQLIREGYKPDMKKRGSVRTVFDGRYKFSRYFSPLDRNSPQTIEQLYQWNDVELFDHADDSEEVKNLAADRKANDKLIMAMNAKLEAVIKDEIGKDDGREMPNIPLVDWTIDRVDL
ncbi:MAG: sulfatase-like hydrolase/transferase [Hyphomicrobiaceae bacterium]